MFASLLEILPEMGFKIDYKPTFPNAQVAELVDALDSNSSGLGRAGSIPALGTKTPDNH